MRERNFFLAAEDMHHRGVPATAGDVAGVLQEYFGYVDPDPGARVAALQRQGFLKRPLIRHRVRRAGDVRDAVLPSRRGRGQVEALEEAYYLTRGMIHGAKSEAFRALCRARQGLPFCQHGSLTGGQLAALERLIVRARPSRIIDLGCGVGELGRYLAEAAGSDLLGVDRSRASIDYARRRIAVRADGHRYLCGNLEAFVHAEGTAAGTERCIVAIDALYWLHEPVAFFERCMDFLAPGGVLVVIWSEFAERPRGARNLGWRDTGLGSALSVALRDRGDISVAARDFTEEERALWLDTPALCAGREQSFAAEGRLYLLRTLMRTAEHLEDVMRNGPGARYLLAVSRQTG